MKYLKSIRWVGRVIALVLLVLGLVFYFGYGNPLPFANPDYTWIENVWLTLAPLVFVGLAVGWKYEKVGGYFIVISLAIGFVLGLLAEANFSINMLIFLIPGVLYLVAGDKQEINAIDQSNS